MGIIKTPLPAVRAVARCALLVGLLTAAYAAYSVHCLPYFLQCLRYADLDVAALPRWLLGCSAVQAAAAALSLLLTGRARRALAFLALAATVASLAVLVMILAMFIIYSLSLAGYGATILKLAIVGEGAALGFIVPVNVVLGAFVAVFRGQE